PGRAPGSARATAREAPSARRRACATTCSPRASPGCAGACSGADSLRDRPFFVAGLHLEMASIRADDDRADTIGAQHLCTRIAERLHHLRTRMSVCIVRADAHEREARPHGA